MGRFASFCFVLALTALLPLYAWAVDTDGDGVDDSLDAFPTKPEASVDTDGDGQPNSLVEANIPLLEDFEAPLSGWTLGGAATRVTTRHFSGSADGGSNTVAGTGTFTRSMQSGTVIYYAAAMNVAGLFPLKVDGANVSSSCVDAGVRNGTDPFYYAKWFRCVATLQPATHSLQWTVKYTNYMNNPSYPIYFDVDHIQVSTLVADTDDDGDGVLDTSDAFPLDPAESVDTDLDGIGNHADLDDDGDGVPDYIDADPLSAAINTEKILPVNSNYRGGAVSESQVVSP